MRIGSTDLNSFYRAAEAFLKDLRAVPVCEIWLHYVGNLAEPFANALTARIERMADERIPGKHARKRFMSSFLEALQNVRNHGRSGHDDKMHAAITIFQEGGYLYIDVMNVVTNKQADLVEKKYREAKALDRVALKKHYMDVMTHGELSLKGGAGLGILSIILKSDVPVETLSKSIGTDFKFFSVRLGVSIASA